MSKQPKIVEIGGEDFAQSNENDIDNNSNILNIEQHNEKIINNINNTKSEKVNSKHENVDNSNDNHKNDIKQNNNKREINKDLLRLEKDYFDNIYHENKDEDIKTFQIKKLLKKESNKTSSSSSSNYKPKIDDIQKSDLLSKVKNFLPEFIKDTQDLCNNTERIAKANIENLPMNEDPKAKLIEMDLYMGIFDIKPNQESKIDKLIIPKSK